MRILLGIAIVIATCVIGGYYDGTDIIPSIGYYWLGVVAGLSIVTIAFSRP